MSTTPTIFFTAWDIGIDNNDFYPMSFNKIREIMADWPDNSNFVKNNAA